MTPDFQVEIDGQDVTDRIASRLISLEVTDEAGLKSDTFSVELDNPDLAIPRPKKGALVRVSMGYTETGLQFMGTYKVDESRSTGSPDTKLSVSGKAADMTADSGKGKTKRSKTYKDKTLGDIAQEAGGRMGISVTVDDELSGVKLDHVSQHNESDFHFLTRLAENHGGVFKVVEGRGVFAKRDRVKSLSGKQTTTVTINRLTSNVGSWTIQEQSRNDVKKVKAKYHDYKKGKHMVVNSADDSEADDSQANEDETTTYTITHRHRNKEQAKAAVDAEADRRKRGTKTGSIALLTGDPRYTAESRVQLEGFGEDDSAEFKIKSVKHSLSGGGYTSNIDIETPKDSAKKDKSDS